MTKISVDAHIEGENKSKGLKKLELKLFGY